MADGPNPPSYDGGAEFVLTHEPAGPAGPGGHTFLTVDIGETVATAWTPQAARTSKSSVA